MDGIKTNTLCLWHSSFEIKQGNDTLFNSLAVLHDPVVCRDGHTMCCTCLDTALSTGIRTCPVDRNYLGIARSARNLALQAMILKLIIKCPNGSGCSWTGAIENLQQHQQECPMEMLTCTNTDCSAMVYQYEMDAHQKKCPHQTITCDNCQGKGKVIEMTEHKKNCPKSAVECPNKCGEVVLRYELSFHEIGFVLYT